MKNKLISFFTIFVSIFFLATGCSNKNITDVDVIMNNVKDQYLVLEEVNIEDLKFVVSFDDNTSTTYSLTDKMFEYDPIDNTIEGSQLVNIYFKTDNYKQTIPLYLEFTLPQEVQEINNKITSLPLIHQLNFDYESDITSIEEMYHNIEEKYQRYVYKYDEFLSKKSYFNEKKETLITVDVLSQRNVYLNVLNNLFYSLDSDKYTTSSWGEINSIYIEGIKQLNNNNNYNNMYQIIKDTREKIIGVKTIEQTSFIEYQNYMVNSLINYMQAFDLKLYSSDRVIELDNILLEGIDCISTSKTLDIVNRVFIEYCEKMDNVLSIEEEKIVALDSMISEKLIEIAQYYSKIDTSLYDADEIKLINSYLNRCQSLVQKSTTEVSMNKYINDLKIQINGVPTSEEKTIQLLNKYKDEAKERLNTYYETIELYGYDTTSKLKIEKIVQDTISNIDNELNYEEIDNMIEKAKLEISEFKTIAEQLLLKHNAKIKYYLTEVENYITNYNETSYSEENWSVIISIVNDMKEYLSEASIDVENVIIENYLNENYLKIENVLTAAEEYVLLLNKVKEDAKNETIEYYISLNSSSYNDSQWTFITDKIENVINIIDDLDNIESIDKLVDDTITSIELI